jgi:molybdopterin-biosynthesis enzyme MoeA-like protein
MASGDEARVTAAVLIIGDVDALGAEIEGDVAEARTVPDVMEEIIGALNALRARYDYVVTTGGIGPTHDDITADAVAAAFGVELVEHPGILEMMETKWGPALTPARRRMARIPVGGDLVNNPIQGPPGFTIGNVFVLAGVPQVMRGMLEDVGPRLKGGAVMRSRTVRVEGTGEGVLAAPLEAVAKAHPAMALGSYPFFGPEGYGSQLVLRGRDPQELAAAVGELLAALEAAGIGQVTEVEG